VVKFWQKRAWNYANPFMRENTRGYRRKTVNLHVELVSDERGWLLHLISLLRRLQVTAKRSHPSARHLQTPQKGRRGCTLPIESH
jgi:hypothetical protein